MILDDLPPPIEEFKAIQQQLRHEMGRRPQPPKTAFNTIKNPDPKQKASELRNTSDHTGTYPVGLIIILILSFFIEATIR